MTLIKRLFGDRRENSMYVIEKGFDEFLPNLFLRGTQYQGDIEDEADFVVDDWIKERIREVKKVEG